MKLVLLIILGLAFTGTVNAKSNCKNSKHIETSCEGVKGKKRNFICSKSELTEAKKNKACKAKNKVKNKKQAKNKVKKNKQVKNKAKKKTVHSE